MKIARGIAACVCVAGIGVSGVAFAGGSSSPVRSSSSSNATRAPMSAAELLSRFQGEWQGRLEVRNEQGVSVSQVSMSNRYEARQGRFVGGFTGFAFGEPMDGATMLAVSSKGQPMGYWWTSDLGDRGERWAFEVGEDGVSLVGTGSVRERRITKQYRHVMRSVSSNEMEIAWFEVQKNGQIGEMPMAKMMMKRMARNEQAQASSMFEDGTMAAWQTSVGASIAEVVD